MKSHYIAAAQAQADSEGTKITDSRLSVMTGLQRRDISRLKDLKLKEKRVHHLARLVALWQTEADYPETIAKSGPAPSFEALAQIVHRDVHPRTMLDALEAADTVSIKGDTVTLEATSYQPLAGTDDQIAYLARNVGDHATAATENVLGRDPRHFERAVHYTKLTPEHIAELETDFAQAEMEILEKISRKAAKMKNDGSGTQRFRAGGYFYTTRGDT
ncbi:MAG: hypothetical protein HKN27_00090 [Silicimonas sp.]|nr:hypothetical protein [Silicimonas sp.]